MSRTNLTAVAAAYSTPAAVARTLANLRAGTVPPECFKTAAELVDPWDGLLADDVRTRYPSAGFDDESFNDQVDTAAYEASAADDELAADDLAIRQHEATRALSELAERYGIDAARQVLASLGYAA